MLPSMAEVWGWHEELAAMGTRYTGSCGHVSFTEWLQERFSALPGFRPNTDRIFFDRWLAEDYSLSIDQDAAVGPSGPVPVSYYYPYSGTTAPVALAASWSTSARTRRPGTRRPSGRRRRARLRSCGYLHPRSRSTLARCRPGVSSPARPHCRPRSTMRCTRACLRIRCTRGSSPPSRCWTRGMPAYVA